MKFLLQMISCSAIAVNLWAAPPLAVVGKPAIETKSFLDLKKALLGSQKKSLSNSSSALLGRGNNPKSQLRTGGSSDGGGNSVGSQLFDFYEAEGSVEVTLEELFEIEPSLIIIRSHLEQIVTSINGRHLSFAEVLFAPIRRKRLILDTKPIWSEDCVNQSLVSTESQQVRGCQNELEVRLDLNWLAEAPAPNPAGLIMHEIFLSWLRSLQLRDSKASLEQKVRILTRDIFTKGASQEFVDTLENLTQRSSFLLKQNALKAYELDRTLKNEWNLFCDAPSMKLYDVLDSIGQDSSLTIARQFSAGNSYATRFLQQMPMLIRLRAGEQKTSIRHIVDSNHLKSLIREQALTAAEYEILKAECQAIKFPY